MSVRGFGRLSPCGGGGRWFGNQICWISPNWAGLELSGVSLVWRVLIGVGLVVFVGVTLWRALELIKDLKSPRRISDYLTERRASKAVERGLLSAGLVRKTVSETMVQVPTCLDCRRRSEHGSDC